MSGASPDSLDRFRAEARRQAHWCRRLDSPFTALVCDTLADRVRAGTPLGERLAGWPGDMIADVVALRLCGGLHARVLAGDRALGVLYPPAPLPEGHALADAIGPLLDGGALLPALDSAPQTNEVGRSGVLMPGLMTVAAETGLPLRLIELGASAGLNLILDRYRYRLGGLEAGDPASTVLLAPDWAGGDPPDAVPVVAERLGCDLNPLGLADPAARLRMLSYVWPDQPERLARMQAAAAIAAAGPPPVERGDAADFVEAHAQPRPGVATVVYHSIAFQYFPAATRRRVAAHMAAAGARATVDAPLAWLTYEFDDPTVAEPPTLRLRLWRGAADDGSDRLLARAHPHGARVEWLA